MFNGIFAVQLHGLLAHPTYHCFHILCCCGHIVGFSQHIATSQVNIIFQGKSHGHGRPGFLTGAIIAVDGFNVGCDHGWERHNFIAGLEYTSCNPSGITAVIVKFIG